MLGDEAQDLKANLVKQKWKVLSWGSDLRRFGFEKVIA